MTLNKHSPQIAAACGKINAVAYNGGNRVYTDILRQLKPEHFHGVYLDVVSIDLRPIRISASIGIEVASIPSALCARFDRTGLMWIVSGLTRSMYGR